jgi:hypothetical protein
MAASNPVIGERVIADDNVRCILAEMMMEGLYERSDDWAFEVGLPGKSGVGGGLLAVAPGAPCHRVLPSTRRSRQQREGPARRGCDREGAGRERVQLRNRSGPKGKVRIEIAAVPIRRISGVLGMRVSTRAQFASTIAPHRSVRRTSATALPPHFYIEGIL